MSSHPPRRVVITGVGVVAPGGVGSRQFWSLISNGQTATRRVTHFDASQFRSQVAAEVDCSFASLAGPDIETLDRAAKFALLATYEAISSSGLNLSSFSDSTAGVSLGTAVGATVGLENEFQRLTNGGQSKPQYDLVEPYLANYLTPSSFSERIAAELRISGPVNVVSTGCTSGIDAVGYAAEQITDDCLDVMICGATEAPISPITIACFDAIKATTADTDNPENASRPFDATRSGFVLGEGCAMFVLEERAHAIARGAEILAEIVGYSSRSNAFHMTGLRPDAREMSMAIRDVLSQSHTNTDEVSYISAHGSGTRQNDLHETNAYKAIFKENAPKIPISSIKSMIGHSLGAIGSIEIAASVLAMREQVVPPTANLVHSDPECDLDYVPLTARNVEITNVLKVGSGFGGFQSAMMLRCP